MARFVLAQESLSGQLSGLPSGLTFNGYFAAVMAGSSAGFKLRRVILGVRNTGGGSPTSQQQTVAVYRQTVACAGTGFTLTAGDNTDPNTPASAIGGQLITTATAAGTTGPTLGATSLYKFSFNTQALVDELLELPDELVCASGTANGLAFVNIGSSLPGSHVFSITTVWEE